jgi:hypothetical protein
MAQRQARKGTRAGKKMHKGRHEKAQGKARKGTKAGQERHTSGRKKTTKAGKERHKGRQGIVQK